MPRISVEVRFLSDFEASVDLPGGAGSLDLLGLACLFTARMFANLSSETYLRQNLADQLVALFLQDDPRSFSPDSPVRLVESSATTPSRRRFSITTDTSATELHRSSFNVKQQGFRLNNPALNRCSVTAAVVMVRALLRGLDLPEANRIAGAAAQVASTQMLISVFSQVNVAQDAFDESFDAERPMADDASPGALFAAARQFVGVTSGEKQFDTSRAPGDKSHFAINLSLLAASILRFDRLWSIDAPDDRKRFASEAAAWLHPLLLGVFDGNPSFELTCQTILAGYDWRCAERFIDSNAWDQPIDDRLQEAVRRIRVTAPTADVGEIAKTLGHGTETKALVGLNSPGRAVFGPAFLEAGFRHFMISLGVTRTLGASPMARARAGFLIGAALRDIERCLGKTTLLPVGLDDLVEILPVVGTAHADGASSEESPGTGTTAQGPPSTSLVTVAGSVSEWTPAKSRSTTSAASAGAGRGRVGTLAVVLIAVAAAMAGAAGAIVAMKTSQTSASVNAALNSTTAPDPVADVLIPRGLIGKPAASVVKLLQGQGFVVETSTSPSKGKAGVVLVISPIPGNKIPVGSAVSLVVSAHPIPKVDDVVGHPILEAKLKLRQAGLRLKVVGYVASGRPVGTVLDQDPAASTEVPAGTTISVHVARAFVWKIVWSARGGLLTRGPLRTYPDHWLLRYTAGAGDSTGMVSIYVSIIGSDGQEADNFWINGAGTGEYAPTLGAGSWAIQVDPKLSGTWSMIAEKQG